MNPVVDVGDMSAGRADRMNRNEVAAIFLCAKTSDKLERSDTRILCDNG